VEWSSNGNDAASVQFEFSNARKEQTVSTITKAKYRVPTVPTTKQVEDVFAELIRVGDLDTYHAGLLAVDCGLRRGEIVALHPRQFDFNDGIIKVFAPNTRPRVVFMSDRVRRELRGLWPLAGPDVHAFLPHYDRSAAGKKLEAGLRRVAGNLGIPVRFHLLRHKFAVDCVSRGALANDVAKALGLTPWGHADSTLAYFHAMEGARDRKGLPHVASAGTPPAPEKF
jgi:integrase